jgi:hypothetical protein
LNNREKDADKEAVQREVQSLTDSFSSEIEQQKLSHEAQIKVIRKNRDETVADNAKLKAEKNRCMCIVCRVFIYVGVSACVLLLKSE